jgi:alkylated DNA repair dioxygenase AlkB
VTGGGSRAFDLGEGDLLVMGGTCQRTWQHAVPKAAHGDLRISIQFRSAVVVAARY